MSDPKGEEPRHWVNDHDALQKFGNDMYLKLRENSHKAHWNTVSNDWLFARLMDEVHELNEVMDEDPEKIIRECADVANFAMMIADNARNHELG